MLLATLAGLVLWAISSGFLSAGAAPVIVDVSVASAADDVEESQSGSVDFGSSDLELVTDGGKVQTLGLRFVGVAVPAGATVSAAWVQFQVDETSSDAVALTIQGEAADNAAAFQSASFKVSSRLRTAAAVSWAPPAWTRVGDAGPNQRTPDLAGVIGEIVARPLWAPGNAMAIVITGSGKRVAEAFEGGPLDPRLHIEYSASEASPSPSPSESSSPSTSPSPSETPTESPSPSPTPSSTGTPTPSPIPKSGRFWNVPGDASTIQQAINAAAPGDTVLVAPGIYPGPISLPGKAITVASHFLTTGAPSFVAQTIIEGGSGGPVKVTSTAGGPVPSLIGFTIRKGSDGIKATGPFRLENCKVTKTGDGIDLTGAKGVIIRNNVFEDNSDDGIDFDGASSGLVEGNTIIANRDDGIEIRLHKYVGPTLEIVIRNNVIQANREDGIQLIDYDGLSSRTFRIEGNLIKDSAQVGLGLMGGGKSSENFSAASIPEPIETFNNTFVNNPAAITGGDNMTVRNNIFTGSTMVALKNVDASSTIAYNLFWNNAADHQDSNVDPATTILADPLLDATYHLQAGSPAIDAGVDVGRPYQGPAPDLGAYEAA